MLEETICRRISSFESESSPPSSGSVVAVGVTGSEVEVGADVAVPVGSTVGVAVTCAAATGLAFAIGLAFTGVDVGSGVLVGRGVVVATGVTFPSPLNATSVWRVGSGTTAAFSASTSAFTTRQL
jgi:hypothetical protein